MVTDFDNYSDIYPGVTAATIRQAASDPKINADVIAGLAGELEQDDKRVARDIEGDIQKGVRSNPQQAAKVSRNLAFNGYYAHGLLNKFASDVAKFDKDVDALNLRLRTTANTRHRQYRNMPDAPPYAEIFNQVKSELRPEYNKLDNTLEDGADDVASGFNNGPSPERMKQLVNAGFIPLAAALQFPSITYTKREMADLYARLKREGRLDEFFAAPAIGTSEKDIRRVVDFARDMGVSPEVYANALQLMYVTKAAEKAGIDLTAWDVNKGASGVADQYEKSYEYYASLYLNNPNFRWAAMASMIGPSFAAGFEDLEFFRTISGDLGKIPDYALPKELKWLNDAGEFGEKDLKFYEKTFLQMQKDIFFDASMMHEAYGELGLDGIKELKAAGLLGEGAQGAHAYSAWQDIDTGTKTGNDDLINQGNKNLLYREQYYTIDQSYEDMKNHPGTGEFMTYVMGVVGQPSIPGTHTLGEVEDGTNFTVDLAPLVPGTQGAEITENLPSGNIADFDTRWGLIEKDTLPVFEKLIEEDPEQVREILNESVRGRIDENSLADRWPEILDSLIDIDYKIK